MNASPALIEQEYRELLPRVLQREPAKVVQFHAKAGSLRAAENWKGSVNAAKVSHFIMLGMHYPELREFALRWWGMDSTAQAINAKAALESIKRMIESLPEEGDTNND